MLTQEDIQGNNELTCKYIILGHLLGYPSCCTRSFVEDCNDVRRIFTRGGRLLYGTGFIPCSSCSVKYTELELITLINSQRMPLLQPFPVDD